ncbi:MAG TPA: hypothetical protein VJ729_04865 [Nitrososphaeraceae archaeon]|nr:hypothetical protein [Nitrososphaeraceae archaeon]
MKKISDKIFDTTEVVIPCHDTFSIGILLVAFGISSIFLIVVDSFTGIYERLPPSLVYHLSCSRVYEPVYNAGSEGLVTISVLKADFSIFR